MKYLGLALVFTIAILVGGSTYLTPVTPSPFKDRFHFTVFGTGTTPVLHLEDGR